MSMRLIREIDELEESTDNKLEQTKNDVRDKIIYKIGIKLSIK